MNKSLNIKMGQTHMQHYLEPLLKKVEEGTIDPSFIKAHHMKLSEAPEAYKKFRNITGQLHQGGAVTMIIFRANKPVLNIEGSNGNFPLDPFFIDRSGIGSDQ